MKDVLPMTKVESCRHKTLSVRNDSAFDLMTSTMDDVSHWFDGSAMDQHKWRVGYWLSSKKSKKLNFEEFTDLCRTVDIQLIQLNSGTDLETHGPFDAIIHKLSDVIVQADQNDEEAKKTISTLEAYVDAHPDMVMIDPIPCVRTLCDRFTQYMLVQEICRTDNVYTPPFVDLTSADVDENLRKLTNSNVKFPFVCKPLVAHGSTFAHNMSIIFGEQGLKDVRPPCVAQSFVPHNAVLYKVFVMGNRHFTCPRPSLKNFIAGDFPTIFFDSHEVSKGGCTSWLCELDESEANGPPPTIHEEKIAAVVRDVRDRTSLTLFGLDVIVENITHYHYIIDVNAFPSYDGVPGFSDHLLQLLSEALNHRDMDLRRQAPSAEPKPSGELVCWNGALTGRGRTPPDSGIGSCTESDNSDCERKLMAALRIRQQQADQRIPRPVSISGFIPSWQRIKKFYGIPKPSSSANFATVSPPNKAAATAVVNVPANKAVTPARTTKPRSRTIS